MSAVHLYVLGAGSHGLVVAEAAAAQGQYVIAGFIDDKVASQKQKVDAASEGSSPCASVPKVGQWPVFHSDAVKPSPSHRLIVAIGDNALRGRLSFSMASQGWVLANVIHPTAWVSPSAVLGEGVYVGPQAAINALAHVDHGAIINTGAIVEHHCHVQRFAHLCPRTALAGYVTIGQMTMLGTGASVCPRVNIGRDCVIGAGAAVSDDILDGRLAMGVPAKCRPY